MYKSSGTGALKLDYSGSHLWLFVPFITYFGFTCLCLSPLSNANELAVMLAHYEHVVSRFALSPA